MERYLRLAAEATTPQQVAELVLAATADPHIFTFGELLAAPKLSALQGTGQQPSYDLLVLFAYHTYADYAGAKARYPTLSAAHERKLRLLSVVTLANRTSSVTYNDIRSTLHVQTVRQVEDAVLDAIYAGLLRARLDQRAGRVDVLSASARDVPHRTAIPDMLALLERWAASARDTVASIDTVVGSMQGATANSARERKGVEEEIAAARTSLFGAGTDVGVSSAARSGMRPDALGAAASATGVRFNL